MASYLAMGFSPAGLVKRYAKLNGVEHQLLEHDFRQVDVILKDNPFGDLCTTPLDQVTLPNHLPSTNLVDESFSEPLRMAVGA
jgi:hypothetical protein